jgi:predicted O-linked N-acetylglucosamine transferase (SPINDLY family)
VKSAFDHFHPVGHLSDDEAADLIQSLEIDVLVDLQGLSGRARPNLIAQGAAPVQIAYLGYPGTTCLPHVDYVVADKFVFPEELKPHFSEEPLYLDTAFQVSDSKRKIGSEKSRSFYGLPEDKFVFCSFNNAYKYTPEVISTWSEILNQCPDSILWLLEDNQWSKANLLAEFKKNGVDVDRIYFAGRIPPEDYLARFKCADLFLDTFPYNAGTTANDSLFAGLPVLTLAGKTYVSRMAGSLLYRNNFHKNITYSAQEYIERSIELYFGDPQINFHRIDEIKSRNIETIKDLEKKILNLLKERSI